MASVTIRTQFEQLRKLVAERDKLFARNNAEAARNPAFAANLRALRASPLYQQADAALRNAYQQAAQAQAMGAWEIAAIGSVVGIAIVAAISTIYLVNQWEQRAFDQANPTQAVLRTGTTALFGLLGLGVVVVGGFLYWDYRQGKAQQMSRMGYQQSPFDRGGSLPTPRQPPRFAEDMKSMRREMKEAFAKTPVPDEEMKTRAYVPSKTAKELKKFRQQVESEKQFEKDQQQAPRSQTQRVDQRRHAPSPFSRNRGKRHLKRTS